MKELKSLGLVVLVDTANQSKERQLIPSEVAEGLRAAGNSIPSVFVTSADLTQNFGSFSYKKLKSGDYRKIFKDAKEKIREAKKAGTLAVLGSSSSGKAVSTKTTTDKSTGAEDEMEDQPGVVKIKNPKLITLKTTKGTTVNAKLLRVVHNEIYVFETDKGKKIEAKLRHLSYESRDLVEKILEENTG